MEGGTIQRNTQSRFQLQGSASPEPSLPWPQGLPERLANSRVIGDGGFMFVQVVRQLHRE